MQAFADALKAAGKTVEYVQVEGAGHTAAFGGSGNAQHNVVVGEAIFAAEPDRGRKRGEAARH